MATSRVDTTAERGRISARVSQSVVEVIEQAATLLGSTVNQFVAQAALEKAEKVVEKERLIRMSAQEAAWFFELLDNPPAPSSRLVDAFQRHQAREV